MTSIILLLAVGIVLLVLEVLVPGGVLGVIGGLLMLAGCVLAFLDFGLAGGATATGVSLAVLVLALYIEFVLLPKTAAGKKMFLQRAIEGASQPLPADPKSAIGEVVEALTTLAPTGYVLFNGHRSEARSQSGLIAKGTRVQVVGVDNFSLIVSQL